MWNSGLENSPFGNILEWPLPLLVAMFFFWLFMFIDIHMKIAGYDKIKKIITDWTDNPTGAPALDLEEFLCSHANKIAHQDIKIEDYEAANKTIQNREDARVAVIKHFENEFKIQERRIEKLQTQRDAADKSRQLETTALVRYVKKYGDELLQQIRGKGDNDADESV